MDLPRLLVAVGGVFTASRAFLAVAPGLSQLLHVGGVAPAASWDRSIIRVRTPIPCHAG